MIAKDDPGYIIEEYKGQKIASHKNNISQNQLAMKGEFTE